MIVSYIMNVMDPRLHKSVVYVEIAFELRENIKKLYAVLNYKDP